MLILILDSMSPVYVCDLLNLILMWGDAEMESSDILCNLHLLKPVPWYFETQRCGFFSGPLQPTDVGLDFETHDAGSAAQDEL